VHQFNVFTVNTPMQHGLARYMPTRRPTCSCRPSTSQARPVPRRPGPGPLRLLPSEGSYFQCVDISRRARDLSEADFCQWLTREIGVAAIPLSAFYGDGFDQKLIRFCFAKQDGTLRAAMERLARL
jgi:methionine aminotransferase